MEMNRNRKISLAVLAAIVVVVAGIYIVKNLPQQAATTTTPTNGNNVAIDASTDDEALVLKSESIDLAALAVYNVPILIDFGSTTCQPCILMAPELQAIHDETLGKAIVKYVDVEASPDTASDFPIMVTPTQVFINADGTPYVPSEAMSEKFEFIMYSHKDTDEHLFTIHQGGLSADQMREILQDMGATV